MDLQFQSANDNPAPGANLSDLERVRLAFDELAKVMPKVDGQHASAVEAAMTLLQIAVEKRGSKVRRFNAWADLTDTIAACLPEEAEMEDEEHDAMIDALVELDTALERIAFQEGWEPSLNFSQPEVTEAQDLQKTLATDPVGFRDASSMVEALQEHYAPCLQEERETQPTPLERAGKAYHALKNRRKEGALPLPAAYKLQQLEPLLEPLLGH